MSIADDKDVLDITTGSGSDLGGELIIDEGAMDDSSINDAVNTAIGPETTVAGDASDTVNTVDTGATIAGGAGNDPSGSDKVTSPTDQTSPRTCGRRGRGRVRSVIHIVSHSADKGTVPIPSDGGPPAKRSRSSSNTRRGRGSRRCSPLVRPTPPPRQPTPELAVQAVEAHLANVAEMSKDYIAKHADHGCFGKRGDNIKYGSCKVIKSVGRGKLPAQFIRRWENLPDEYTGRCPDGYYDEDPDYYTDPLALNPPKSGKSEYCDDHYQGEFTVTDTVDATSDGGVDVGAGSSSMMVTFDVRPEGGRVVDMNRGSVGESVIANTITAAADSQAMEFDEEEEDRLLQPHSILRPSRTYEQGLRERATTMVIPKIVQINESGVRTYVLTDIDPRTGRMEDRRGQHIILKREREAAEKRRVKRMTAAEVLAAADDIEAKASAKSARRQRRKMIYTRRLQSSNRNKVYCGVGNFTKVGDYYIGGQAAAMTKASRFMALAVTKLARKRQNDKLITDDVDDATGSWAEVTDNASEVDFIDDGDDLTNCDLEDPTLDISLARAEDFSLVNSLWSHAKTMASVAAERMTAERIALDESTVMKWLETSMPGFGVANADGEQAPDVDAAAAAFATACTIGSDAVDDHKLALAELDDSLTRLDLDEKKVKGSTPVDAANEHVPSNPIAGVGKSTSTHSIFSAEAGSTFPSSGSESSAAAGTSATGTSGAAETGTTVTTSSDASGASTESIDNTGNDPNKADDLDASIPWDEYVAPVVPPDPLDGHEVLIRDEDVEFDPSIRRFHHRDFRPVEDNNLLFITNKAGRRYRYLETGEVDNDLIDQVTQGLVLNLFTYITIGNGFDIAVNVSFDGDFSVLVDMFFVLANIFVVTKKVFTTSHTSMPLLDLLEPTMHLMMAPPTLMETTYSGYINRNTFEIETTC